MAYGTLNTLDTLASSQQSVAAYGEDRAFEAIEAALRAHNDIMNAVTSDLVERTTDQQRRYGGGASMSMDEVDEFGRGDAQKISAGVTIGFPLRLFDITLQWTRKFMQNATTAELAAQTTAAMDSHRKRVIREIKRAIFYSSNTTFVDRLTNHISLAVKALVNADSAEIPLGPNGESFDATTHTHYLARVSTLAASDITSLIDTVREHYATGEQFLYINRASETAIRGFTSNFVAYPYQFVIPADNTARLPGNLDMSNPYNRAIGVFDGVQVWVKPWVPANYMVSFINTIKPLVLRERAPGSGGLVLAADDEAYPLRARTMEAEFGVGVWQRTGMAVLYTGGTSYTNPTLTD